MTPVMLLHSAYPTALQYPLCDGSPGKALRKQTFKEACRLLGGKGRSSSGRLIERALAAGSRRYSSVYRKQASDVSFPLIVSMEILIPVRSILTFKVFVFRLSASGCNPAPGDLPNRLLFSVQWCSFRFPVRRWS